VEEKQFWLVARTNCHQEKRVLEYVHVCTVGCQKDITIAYM